MPFYDYKCLNCNSTKMDILKNIYDRDNGPICETCGNRMEKMPSTCGFIPCKDMHSYK